MSLEESCILSECAFFNSDESDFIKNDSKPSPWLSFNMFGTCSVRNIKHIIRQNRALKPLRLYLLKSVLKVCQSANIQCFVYGGTALSVFRENGKIIPHDTDIDLGVLEYDDHGRGAFTLLFLYCLKNKIPFGGVNMPSGFDYDDNDGEVYVDFSASLQKNPWMEAQSDKMEDIIEKPYHGFDCKRAKFYLSNKGLLKACRELNLKPKFVKHVNSDPALVHVDLFTLSPHPTSPATHLRVNWNLPGVYNCDRKMFPLEAILPLKSCLFEGINVLSPAQLDTYLSVEYGYLGRDAIFSHEKQLYVKMPEHYTCYLPTYFQNNSL